MMQQNPSQTALVCDLTAMNAEQRKRYQAILEQLHQSLQEVKEFGNGYAFRYIADSSTLLLVAEFITLERLCCPFLDFTLQVERERGPVWLRVMGPKGTKEFLRAELGYDGDQR